MSSISDPGRPGRRDRKRAQKLIDTAFAEGRLTAADRALRTERIAAAHTRGDLAMITRDLEAPTSASLGKAIDPATLSSMRAGRTGSSVPASGTSQTIPATLDLTGVQRQVKRVVLVAVVAFVALCGLGLAVAIPPFIRGFHEATSETTAAPQSAAPNGQPSVEKPAGSAANLHSAAGWRSLVAAIKSASGSTSVYDLVVYPAYAAVGLDGDGAVDRRFYRDGRWQESVSVRTPAVGALVDLAQIDPHVIARLPGETARHFDIDEPSGTYVIVNAIVGGPRIMVYVQTSDGGSQYRAYDLDGRPIA
ncbi:MAG TPA: DUF1707 domain-containing protein [Aeromicrobium sp.]|nr:DUF1707 domain-containing protein [Aeromicrobium sp.]